MADASRTPFEALVPDIANGVRAAIATMLPFYLASSLGRPELAWTALGGWLGTLVDPGGSRTARMKALVLFVLLGGLALVLAELASPTPWLAAVALVSTAFVGSLFRVLGASSTTLGTMLVILVAIGSATRAPEPLRDAGLFALGATWATALSAVVWPIWTHLPVRRAVGAVFEKMAAYAEDLEAAIAADIPPGDAQWITLARTHRRQIRDAIEAARKMALAIRARRAGESNVGANVRILLGLAEAQFPLLVAIAEGIETDDRDRRSHGKRTLEAVRRRYRAIHRSLIRTVIVSRRQRPLPPPTSIDPRVERSSDAVGRRLLDASALASNIGRTLDVQHDAPESRRPDRPRGFGRVRDAVAALATNLRSLRDALSPASPHFRHALRVAGAAGVASLVGQRVSPDHTTWVTVTTVAVLQPYPATTWKRAAERVLGTLLGSVVAVVVTMTVHGSLGLLLVMFPMCVAAVATRPRSYRLFTFFLTPVFVLLAERHPGGWMTAAVRAGDAALGGGIALFVALFVFPSWEHTRLPDALDDMFAKTMAYAAAVFASVSRPGTEGLAEMESARRACGVALSEAEASLERLIAEPLRNNASIAADGMQLVTYTRRLAGAITALEINVHHASSANESGTALGKAIRDEHVDAYLADALSAARTFVKTRRPTALGTPPPHLASAEPRLAVIVDRVVAHAALIAGLAAARDGNRVVAGAIGR